MLKSYAVDELEQLKNKVRFIFEVYKNGTSRMEIYEINGELIFGSSDEIGYKILIASPENLVADAQISYEWHNKLMEGIAYADLNGLEVPAIARKADAKYKLDPKFKPPNKGGRPKDVSFSTCIRIAILECMRAGMQPTKNEATSRNKICAADVVWDVLFDLDLAAGYQDSFAIMRAWSREITRLPLDKT